MEYSKKDTEELEAQVARIRARRNGGFDNEKIRKVLNLIFLIGAGIGLAIYFAYPEKHVTGLCVIGASMFFKLGEFIMRLIH